MSHGGRVQERVWRVVSIRHIAVRSGVEPTTSKIEIMEVRAAETGGGGWDVRLALALPLGAH